MAKFAHLHTHSHYSLLDGLSKIDKLVDHVKGLGMDSVALTDHGVLYGAVEFYKAAKKAGIKPILGVETYVAPKDRFSKEAGERYHHLVLLAENNTGWQNLIQLVTKAHLEGYYYKARIDKELLKEHHEGLIALSGCLGGEIAQALLNGTYDDAVRIATEYEAIMGKGNYFIEIQKHPNIPDSEKIEKLLLKLSEETGIPLVATQDSHYLRPEDAEYQDVLLAVQTGNTVNDPGRMTMKDEDYSIISPEDAEKKFAFAPGAAEQTLAIAERCNVTLELDKTHLPNFEKPDGKSANEYLRELVVERLPARFTKEQQTPDVLERVEYEMGVIEKTGYADYFLIVQDLIMWAKSHGIAVGPGRGSAAGSLVSYILKITDLNPLSYDLLFERFLNPERIQMPDIDIDFADARRDEVLQYAREKYGHDRVAQIITFGTMAARAAVRDAGRAMGLSYAFCDQIAKLLPPMNAKIQEAIVEVPELAELYAKNADAKKLLDTAHHLEGVVRHASVHACGTVISMEPLTNYVPLQYPPQDKDRIITQFEMHAIEDLGLLKIDFLGLKNLTIIQDTLRLIEERRGETIDISTIPLDDAKTFELLRTGDTTGVFQFECLSGDTIISNTTLKKLYEKRDKETLQSVYLDEGKIHKNKILDVIKSGVKDVYALVAENGWYIKATKEHNFMTENGWKKLGKIKIGEKVLMKTKAKHLIYNLCRTCSMQIDGQKNAQAKFCYSCSARFYSNPSKEISRQKISAGKQAFHQNGGTVWNEGLTVETSTAVAEVGHKISLALEGRSFEDKFGIEKATEMKAAMSARYSGSGNPMFGKPSPHRNGGYREDLGHYVRSNWEADFARVLNLHKIAYQYEPRTFPLKRITGEIINYTPDFYVPSTETFYEIKGWYHEADEEKIKLFVEQYPEYQFVLIEKTKFAELAMKYKKLVAWECPRIPVKQSFAFIEVKDIIHIGPEETYDIAMEAPGNNFIANGFMVHNSSGMRRYMKELKPTVFEDLIALVALFRPGPMELIPSFIKRKHGEETITYLHPRLEPIMRNTYGIGVYQEQMMRIARDLGGYSLGEADTLRKAIGKKIKALLDEQKEKLIKGMVAGGIELKIAKAIWEMFPPFARYGFNKSHAACYALIGYQTAYLRAHYSIELMTALMNADAGDTDRISFLINEAKQNSIEVLPPDVNQSFVSFTPDGEDKIRFGLLAIKNVGAHVTEVIIAERVKGGPFKDFTEFVTRVQDKDLNKKSLESLAKCGAFDSLEIERNQILENIEDIIKYTSALKKGTGNGTMSSLFGATTPVTIKLTLKPAVPAETPVKLKWEKELLGFYLSDHPLHAHDEKIKKAQAQPITDVRLIKSETQTVRIAGVIADVKKIFTKKGDPMVFARIEDFSPLPIEVVVFNSTYEKTAAIWEMNNVVVIQGKISNRNGETKLICDQAIKLS